MDMAPVHMAWTGAVRSRGAAFRLPPATTSAARAGSRGTTVRAPAFRWSRKELTHGSCQKDDTFSQNSGAQEHQTRRTEALVTARDERERRARPQTRRVQADQCEEDRGFVEALGRAQRASQDRRLPLGAVDADVLHQPRRQDAAADAAHAAGAGKGGAEAGIREGVSATSSCTSAAPIQDLLPQGAIWR